MKKVVAIVAVKKDSVRLKNKNILLKNKKPLFMHSINPLLKSKIVDEIYVSTNSEIALNYCKKFKIKTIWRNYANSRNNQPLLDVLQYSYRKIKKSYKYIITIMANCPGHSVKKVNECIKLIQKYKLKEVRSFNNQGEENGLMVFERKYFLKKKELSTYMGIIKSPVFEIHYFNEFQKFKKKK